MLDWWRERLRHRLVHRPCARGFFTDQKSIDLVPGLFDHHLVKDPSWNAAYWNLATRPARPADAMAASRSAGTQPPSSTSPATAPPCRTCSASTRGARPARAAQRGPAPAELCDDYGSRLVDGWLPRPSARLRRAVRPRDGVELDRARPPPRARRADGSAQRTRPAPPSYRCCHRPARAGLPLDEWLAAPDPDLAGRRAGPLLTRLPDPPRPAAAYPEVPDGDVERVARLGRGSTAIDEMRASLAR